MLCHVLMVDVVVLAGPGTLEGALDVSSPEKRTMSNESTDLNNHY